MQLISQLTPYERVSDSILKTDQCKNEQQKKHVKIMKNERESERNMCSVYVFAKKKPRQIQS